MQNLKEKIVGSTGTISATASVLGSYQVCHSICLVAISALSIIGITVSGMPLVFFTTVAVPFWIAGISMLLIMSALSTIKCMKFSQKLMLGNFGILVAGIPFANLQSYQKLFWLFGGIIVAMSIVWAFLERYNKKI